MKTTLGTIAAAMLSLTITTTRIRATAPTTETTTAQTDAAAQAIETATVPTDEATPAIMAAQTTETSPARECRVTDLRTEHLAAPLGIDRPAPRLTWRMDDSRRGARQTAWRVTVGVDSAAVARGDARVWDSGRREGGDVLAEYGGERLAPRTRYWWRVEAWDMDGREVLSPVHWFETGMMGTGNWQGTWISDGRDVDYKPAPYFRKEFDVAKEIKSARAYIAAAGLYELSLNGAKVGDHLLDPMYTRFDRRTLYVTHDVTRQLRAGGRNAVGVVLGNGWYNHQSMAVWDFHNAPWRGRPAFCFELHIEYADGTRQVVVSERDWKTSSGPLLLNSIYTGEHYDARLEMPGWDVAGFDDGEWRGVRYRAVPSANVVAQQTVPIRAVEEFPTVKMTRFDDRTYVFDMGRNMSGVTRVRIAGEEGTVVRIAHGERLGANGRLDLSNIDVYYRGDKATEPFQTDILTLSGRADEFTARFNYKGFRYVEVTSDRPVELTPESVTALFVHSDVRPVGTLDTSSELVNGLWRATNNAYLSNLMGYPTDCPQREKNGWTGDGHLAIETALYNFDGLTVYEKWLADHRDEQQPNGVLPDIIPTGGWGYGTANGLDWTSTIAIIPWEIYMFRGDATPLRDCYPNIKRYVDYVERTSRGGLTRFGRGDWVPVSVGSNLELTSSVYFFADASILARAARMFGHEEDAARYSALAERIRTAINDKYLDRERAVYADGTQTELSVPLHWGVVPDELRARVAANLNRKVEETDYHLDVGVLGAKALLNALNDNGYQATAWRVATQDTYPSWGWWVVNGATTLLENWDLAATRDISDNHMMFGEIGGWFFKGAGGIRPDPERPGFRHVWLAPWFPEGLERFEARHDSPRGEIVSKWERRGRRVTYTVTLPAGSTATLTLPAGATVRRLPVGSSVRTLPTDTAVRTLPQEASQSPSQNVSPNTRSTQSIELESGIYIFELTVK